MRRGALALLVLLSASMSAAADPLSVTAHPIESFGRADGEGPLRFLGGIEVTSHDRRFGGLSGIDMLDAERVVMVSDRGLLVHARLMHDAGRLTGLADVEIGPIFPDGGVSKDVGDVEDIALDPGDLLRGVIVRERQANAMLGFRLENGRATDLKPIRVGAENRILRTNRGLESVAYAPEASALAGNIVTFAEHPPRGMDDIPAWIVGIGQFSVVPHDSFGISSARFLPDGNLLLLERRLTATRGLGMRLRLIPGDAIEVGARLDGKILLEAGMASQIDNMEGLAVQQDEAGRVILTIVSDDNNSILQRTLILQFALAGED